MISINNKINNLTLLGLSKKSNQGDSIISKLMNEFGVKTEFNDEGVSISKCDIQKDEVEIDFRDCPDLTQTILVVAAVHKIKLKISGVESLKIKETDRLLAMKKELSKIGCNFYEEKNFWILDIRDNEIDDNIHFDTYNDHRMAMAFAPIASIKNIYINNPEVVVKSYPNYWEDLKKIGFIIT
jgi:3-phosphoshikimate 1-carboxyvinyltransferase